MGLTSDYPMNGCLSMYMFLLMIFAFSTAGLASTVFLARCSARKTSAITTDVSAKVKVTHRGGFW